MSIVTPDEVKRFVEKTNATADEETLLTLLIPLVEQSVKDYVGYQIEQATYTHYLPERGRETDVDPLLRDYDMRGNLVVTVAEGGQPQCRQLVLPELPLRSVTSVYEDSGAYGGQGSGDFDSDTLLTAGVDYFVDYTEAGTSKPGIIHRIGSYWPSRHRTVKVTYVAGWTATELLTGPAASIKLATLLAVKAVFAWRGDSPGIVRSERLGDYSATYAGLFDKNGGLPKESKRFLAKWISYARFL